MVGLATLVELEGALRAVFEPVGSVQKVYVSYLDAIPANLLAQSIETHGYAYVVAITGSPATNSRYNINTYSDVIELDAVFSALAKTNRDAYKKLVELFKVFGFGETAHGTLYKRAFRPFLLHNSHKLRLHDCDFYGGNFKPLVEQFEKNWLCSHETTIVISVDD